MAAMPNSYLNPTVRDRLLNYYASDEWFTKISANLALPGSDLSAYLPLLQHYEAITPQVDNIVEREGTLVSMADAIGGQVIGDYFGKVTDLVGQHGNLLWLSDPDRLSLASSLFNREAGSPSITSIIDFIKGTTTGSRSRWNMLQDYLSDAFFPSLDRLRSLEGDAWALIQKIRDQASLEGSNFGILADRLKWYSNASVTSNVGLLTGRTTDLVHFSDNRPSIDNISQLSFNPSNGVVGGTPNFHEFWGSPRLWDQTEGWLNPFDMVGLGGGALRPGLVKSRLQDRVNGYLGDTPIFRTYKNRSAMGGVVDMPPEPWIKGMFYIEEQIPGSPSLPGAITHYYLRMYDGAQWMTLINDLLTGVNMFAPTQPGSWL